MTKIRRVLTLAALALVAVGASRVSSSSNSSIFFSPTSSFAGCFDASLQSGRFSNRASSVSERAASSCALA